MDFKMTDNLRKDVDFNALFRKLGHSLTEIRERALDNILSKLEHQLVCEVDLLHEKHLYIRLLEWFNFTECSRKEEVLNLLRMLSKHSAGAELLQDVGGIEFLTKLRSDLEPNHQPVVDEILDYLMRLPEPNSTNLHAPDCIYQKTTDSALWGQNISSIAQSRSRLSRGLDDHNILVSDSDHTLRRVPEYFTSPGGQTASVQPAPSADQLLFSGNSGESSFRLCTFPWLPLTQTDQQVISSTNSSLIAKEPKLLTSGCQFLAEVVFQDFPAELFLQRPDILKSVLSLLSLPCPANQPVVIQAFKTLTTYTHMLQARIRYFQDPVFYTSRQELNSSNPSLISTSPSSASLAESGLRSSDYRYQGDGQDGDSSVSPSRASSGTTEPNVDNLDLEDGPRLQSQQLSLPQFCVALLQRSLPCLETTNEELGTFVLVLLREAVVVLSAVVDVSMWGDDSDSARYMVDRLSDCLDAICDLLLFHHHSHHASVNKGGHLGELSVHRMLYTGLVFILLRLLSMVPLDHMKSVLPERLKAFLANIVYDEALALSDSAPRTLALSITQSLSLSTPRDYNLAVDACRSLSKTCFFCLRCDDKESSFQDVVALAEDAISSIHISRYLPFVQKFVSFFSCRASKRKSSPECLSRCSDVLLKLLAHSLDVVRQTCYSSVLETIKKSLMVSHARNPQSKDCLKIKFLLNSEILYQIVSFGFSDKIAQVRSSSTECLNHLLKCQVLVSEALWVEFTTALYCCLPVLQSYCDQQTSIGRSVWSMLDPTSTSHNLPLTEKMKGALRIMMLSDKSLRLQAAKHLKWFLSNEHGSESKLPDLSNYAPKDLDCFIVDSVDILDEAPVRSVFTVEGMSQVYKIFTSHPVDQGVKKSAADQLAIMMADPYLHAGFRERGGVETCCYIIRHSVSKHGSTNSTLDSVQGSNSTVLTSTGTAGSTSSTSLTSSATSCVGPCVSILKHIVQHDYTLRHTLARDTDLLHSIVRVCVSFSSNKEVKSTVCHLLALLLFDEVAKFEIISGEQENPGTKFSLPAEVVRRYRLPFKPTVHHTRSIHEMELPDPESDVLQMSGPRDMQRLAWNLAWHGDLRALLQAVKDGTYDQTTDQFEPSLVLTKIDKTILTAIPVEAVLADLVNDIKEASSHVDVLVAVNRLTTFSSALRIPAVVNFFTHSDWYTILDRFLLVEPTSNQDQDLLLHVLKFSKAALRCVNTRTSSSNSVHPALKFFEEKLYCHNGPISCILIQLGLNPEGSTAHTNNTNQRLLEKEVLQLIPCLYTFIPYQLNQKNNYALKGDLIRALMKRLNISDAPQFYNLASLEQILSSLVHLTSKPGWSEQCRDISGFTLCEQLLSSLQEVVWTFHIGRGGTSASFMGRGVTRSTAICLRHLAFEMSRVMKGHDWEQKWLSSRENQVSTQCLNWLLTLWAFRDPEVRCLGVGIAVALTSSESGRIMLSSHCKNLPGGIWGVAFSILLDASECSSVRQQACLLLVNLTAQAMPSGDVETRPGLWQGPVVTDSLYQVMITGVNALVTLLDHTSFIGCISEFIKNLYTSPFIQPVLMTTEIPMVENASQILSVSSETTNGETTERTLLTTVSSLSENRPGTMHETRTPSNYMSELVVNNTSQQVTSPGLACAIVKLLTNLVHLAPQVLITNLQSSGLVLSLSKVINPTTLENLYKTTREQSSILTAREVLTLYSSIADLLKTVILIDTNIRMQVIADSSTIKHFFDCLIIKPFSHDSNDLNHAMNTFFISVFQLMTALLQSNPSFSLKALNEAMEYQWNSLMDTFCVVLETRSNTSLSLACLDFIALLFCEESKNIMKNPDRVLPCASISYLLDSPLDGDVDPTISDKPTSGKLLGKTFVNMFDLVTSNVDKKLFSEERRLKVISCFKSLLVVSRSATGLSLDLGIVENVMEYIKEVHSKLNLETLGSLSKSKIRKEEPYLIELTLVFNFLRNLMYNNTNVKVSCQHSGLTLALQKLWSWCLIDPELLSSVLSLILTYIAHCPSAASSLTNPISTQVTAKLGQGSLYHLLLKRTQREIDKGDLTPILRQLFNILTNSGFNCDCRNILWKNSFVNQFSKINPRRFNKTKNQSGLSILWSEFLLSLSFTIDGQAIVLKIPDVLNALIDLCDLGPTKSQFCCCLILRNLACHATNKAKLLANEELIPCLIRLVENEGDSIEIASSALASLIYNNHKAKVQLKSLNIGPRLLEVLYRLESQTILKSDGAVSHLQTVVDAIRN